MFKSNATSLLKANHFPEWETESTLDEITTAVGRSFAGDKELGAPEEPMFSWMSRGLVPESGDDRVRTVQFMMGFWLERNLRKGGFAFGHPMDDNTSDKSSSSTIDTTLRTCCVLREIDPLQEFRSPSPWSKAVDSATAIWIYMRARMLHKVPDIYLNPSNMDSMATQLEEEGPILEHWHQQYGPAAKHIHVVAVATDPTAQGKGLGSQVMRQVNALADTEGLPLYLECATETNRKFYEKFGYHVVHAPSWKDNKTGKALLVYLMVREPSSSLPEQQ